MSDRDTRRLLHSAFSFVKGSEVNRSTAALTLDHLIEEQIRSLKKGEVREFLDGSGSIRGSRPSKLDRLESLLSNTQKAIQSLRSSK